MDILQLTYFKKIAELENVSRAAEELLVAQPALSKVIRTLETELDAKLFDRTGKRITLNNNGKILLRHTNKILQHLSDAKSEIADAGNSLIGTVSISFQAATRMIPSILLSFKQLYPTIKIVIRKSDGIINSNCDFYIFSSRDEISDPNITTLLKEDCLIGISNTHRLANYPFIDMIDLEDEDFIILQDKKSLSDMIREGCRDAGFIPNISLECDHQSAVFSLLENNMGVTLIPSKTWNVHEHPDIKLKPVRNKEYSRYIHLQQKKDTYLTHAAQLFKDFLIDYFQAL